MTNNIKTVLDENLKELKSDVVAAMDERFTEQENNRKGTVFKLKKNQKGTKKEYFLNDKKTFFITLPTHWFRFKIKYKNFPTELFHQNCIFEGKTRKKLRIFRRNSGNFNFL